VVPKAEQFLAGGLARGDLELTVVHGVDSTIFYGPKEDRIDEWIDNYRGLLTRPSKR
jgi:hypothetical protein